MGKEGKRREEEGTEGNKRRIKGEKKERPA